MAAAETLVEKSPGQLAYEKALADLKQPNCMPGQLIALYPDRVFWYGEDGYGIKLPSGNLVFYSYESGDGIMATEKELKVSEKGYPIDYGNWISLRPYGELPESAIEKVLEFARETKEKCQAMRALSGR